MPTLYQILAFHHPDSKAYTENKVHEGVKLRAEKQIYSYMKFSLMTKEAWNVTVEKRENGPENLFFT